MSSVLFLWKTANLLNSWCDTDTKFLIALKVRSEIVVKCRKTVSFALYAACVALRLQTVARAQMTPNCGKEQAAVLFPFIQPMYCEKNALRTDHMPNWTYNLHFAASLNQKRCGPYVRSPHKPREHDLL